MLKKVKKIVALMMATMALSTLFVTTAFAQENDVEVIEEAKILEEICFVFGRRCDNRCCAQ